jgi:hypothetical protein
MEYDGKVANSPLHFLELLKVNEEPRLTEAEFQLRKGHPTLILVAYVSLENSLRLFSCCLDPKTLLKGAEECRVDEFSVEPASTITCASITPIAIPDAPTRVGATAVATQVDDARGVVGARLAPVRCGHLRLGLGDSCG